MPPKGKSSIAIFGGHQDLRSASKSNKLNIIGRKNATFSLENLHSLAKSLFNVALNVGLMKWSLMAVLPFVVLAIISSQVGVTTSTQTIIDVPKNFCELDNRDSCTDGKCIRYDPRKFKNSPSIMTYFPGGRLGNKITAYLSLLWMKLDFGYDTFFEKESFDVSTISLCKFGILNGLMY